MLWDSYGQSTALLSSSAWFRICLEVCSSTFALRQVVEDFDMSDLVSDTILRGFYVDDLLKSVKTKEDALEVMTSKKQVLKQDGFTLTKFVVNDSDLLAMVDESERAKEVKDITWDMCT